MMPGLGLHEGTGTAAGTRLCGFDRDDVELCGGGLALSANGEIKNCQPFTSQRGQSMLHD